ncbi:MAG: DUF5110 domain-containing protein, partial [Bacteroidota bacterium]|nr:DUF5110 domain-containing protein [Bacteroidota bacterium]
DEDTNYNYEKGAFSTIPFHWDESSQTLTIGERKGTFPGMLQNRTFNVVFVDKSHGNGVSASQKIDKTILYTDKEVRIHLNDSKQFNL